MAVCDKGCLPAAQFVYVFQASLTPAIKKLELGGF